VPDCWAVDRGTGTYQQSWKPPGSSCCLSLLAGGFWPTIDSGTPGGTIIDYFIDIIDYLSDYFIIYIDCFIDYFDYVDYNRLCHLLRLH
jgi:hypothetical protein